jgi:hypothetical protein
VALGIKPTASLHETICVEKPNKICWMENYGKQLKQKANSREWPSAARQAKVLRQQYQ